MSQKIGFAGLSTYDGAPIEFGLFAYSGHEIAEDRTQGQVSLNFSGPMADPADGTFELVIDLELPQARTLAAALIALADWVEAQDRCDNRAKQ